MRLDLDEQKAISSTVRKFCEGSATLYLYGSRIDETKRGGDIDLLLVVTDESVKELVDQKIYYLLAELKESLGDQRIDFSVLTDTEVADDPFFKIILPQAIPLDKWQQ